MRVSADTITALTSSPDFAIDVPTAPSKEDIVKETRRTLTTVVTDILATREVRMACGRGVSQIFNRSALRAERRLDQFNNILRNIPVGFRIVPVFYDTACARLIDKYENSSAVHDMKKEFSRAVKPQFLMHLATHYVSELINLGICAYGVEQMRKGFDPVNAQGVPYPVSVDHIVERAGSGLWGCSKQQDPDRPADSAPSLRVNHFGNLVLLPNQVHILKNIFNDLQHEDHNASLRRKWMMMLVPVRNENFSGFVCPPQAMAGLSLGR